MAEDTTTTTSRNPWGGVMPESAGSWFALGGLVLFAVGVVGSLTVWSAMSDPGIGEPDYGTVETWLGVLAGLTVAGVGLVVAALGFVVNRLDSGR